MEMFIADTHFGHANILSQCRPQFATIEEMNRTIIDNINCKMTRKDLLYIVGDFSFRSQTPPTEFLEAIKPRKILIIGNHDDSWLKKLSEEEIARYFVGVYPAYSYKKNGIEVHLSHFPQLAWNRSHFFAQSLSICGHIHNDRTEAIAAQLFPLVKCQFNAGVDINHFQPVTLEELVANNTAFYRRAYTEEEWTALQSTMEKLR